MPFLSDEEVNSLNHQIDNLEQKRSQLDELNNNYLEQLKKQNAKIRALIALCIVLFLLLIAAVVWALFAKKTNKIETVSTPVKKVLPIKKTEKDTAKQVTKEIQLANKDAEKEVMTYGVQIGAYRKFDVEFSSGIKKIKNQYGLICYVIGNFSTLEKAQEFQLILKDLKLTEAFVVKIYKGEIVE